MKSWTVSTHSHSWPQEPFRRPPSSLSPRRVRRRALVLTALRQTRHEGVSFMYKCLMNNKKNDRKHSHTSRSRSVVYRDVILKKTRKKPPQTFLVNPESTYSSVGHERVSKAINTVHRFFLFFLLAKLPITRAICLRPLLDINYCNIHCRISQRKVAHGSKWADMDQTNRQKITQHSSTGSSLYPSVKAQKHCKRWREQISCAPQLLYRLGATVVREGGANWGGRSSVRHSFQTARRLHPAKVLVTSMGLWTADAPPAAPLAYWLTWCVGVTRPIGRLAAFPGLVCSGCRWGWAGGWASGWVGGGTLRHHRPLRQRSAHLRVHKVGLQLAFALHVDDAATRADVSQSG